MRRWILITIMALLLVSAVSALEMCGDNLEIPADCRMVSPALTCTVYNYSITQVNGSLLETGNLTLLRGNFYYFNFSQSGGDYVVSLCQDFATREVFVRTEGSVMWNAIILSILGFSSLLLVLSFFIKKKTLLPIKILLFLYGMINIFILGAMPFVISSNLADVNSFSPVAAAMFSINILIFTLFVLFYGLHLLNESIFSKVKNLFKDKKKGGSR